MMLFLEMNYGEVQYDVKPIPIEGKVRKLEINHGPNNKVLYFPMEDMGNHRFSITGIPSIPKTKRPKLSFCCAGKKKPKYIPTVRIVKMANALLHWVKKHKEMTDAEYSKLLRVRCTVKEPSLVDDELSPLSPWRPGKHTSLQQGIFFDEGTPSLTAIDRNNRLIQEENSSSRAIKRDKSRKFTKRMTKQISILKNIQELPNEEVNPKTMVEVTEDHEFFYLIDLYGNLKQVSLIDHRIVQEIDKPYTNEDLSRFEGTHPLALTNNKRILFVG
jgi:hypothetical protein